MKKFLIGLSIVCLSTCGVILALGPKVTPVSDSYEFALVNGCKGQVTFTIN